MNENILDIKYEDLVNDTDRYQKEIYQFLGIKTHLMKKKEGIFFTNCKYSSNR